MKHLVPLRSLLPNRRRCGDFGLWKARMWSLRVLWTGSMHCPIRNPRAGVSAKARRFGVYGPRTNALARA